MTDEELASGPDWKQLEPIRFDLALKQAYAEGFAAGQMRVLRMIDCPERARGYMHEWRAGQWDDAREAKWCCHCCRDAPDIIDYAVRHALDGTSADQTPDQGSPATEADGSGP